MEYKQINLEDVKEALYNPRQITDQELNKLKESLQKFGCVRPLVINEATGNLVSGHQMLKAARELKIKTLPYLPVNVSDQEEKVLNLALNKISGSWDDAKLSNMLLSLKDIDIRHISGFSDDDIKSINTQYNFEDISMEYKQLEAEAKEEMDWKAKIDKKEFERIKGAYIEIKQSVGLGSSYSDYANGEVLIALINNILNGFKKPSKVDGMFEDYEQNSLRKNGENFVKLVEENGDKHR
jgi:ParB-like chromosome segregation protein Spo0J